jgi:hypothetical protein
MENDEKNLNWHSFQTADTSDGLLPDRLITAV